MKHSKALMGQLLLLCFFITSCASTYKTNEVANRMPAQDNTVSTQANGDGSKDILHTIKEIYVKGSIDGKHLFMVYGFDNALHDMKAATKNMVDMSALKAAGEDINNKEHDGDYVDSFKQGVEATKDIAKEYPSDVKKFLKWPWKSVKRMANSYKVSFNNASDAFNHSKNPIAGSVKWAGHAIWANVKGAYYLVVEIPATVVGTTVATVGEGAAIPLALPFTLVMNTVEIALETFWFTVYNAARISIKLAIAGIEGAYSLASTTAAASLTLVAAGGLAVLKGVKWVVYGLPHKIKNPVEVHASTEIGVDDQQAYAEKVSKSLEADQSTGLKLTEKNIDKYKSVFNLSAGDVANAVKVTLVVSHTKVKVIAEASRKYLKAIKADGQSMGDLKKEVAEKLDKMVDGLAVVTLN